MIVRLRFVLSAYEFFEYVNEFLPNIRLCSLFNPVIERLDTSENVSSPKSMVAKFSNTRKYNDMYSVLPNPFANNKSVILDGISLY